MTNGTLRESEAHPAALDALEFVKSHSIEDLMKWREAFASCAIEGNRAGEVCGETLDRLLNRQMVSDRYVLGLAWAMRKTPNVELTGGAPGGNNEEPLPERRPVERFVGGDDK